MRNRSPLCDDQADLSLCAAAVVITHRGIGNSLWRELPRPGCHGNAIRQMEFRMRKWSEKDVRIHLYSVINAHKTG